MADKLEHGKRNSALASKLFSEEVYFDWVITTAFYAVIHLVEHDILPKKINGVYCKNIHEVKNEYKKQLRGRPIGLHGARRLLVQHFSFKIFTEYKWLDDHSRTARYKTYKINKSEASKAIQYMEKISKVCIPHSTINN